MIPDHSKKIVVAMSGGVDSSVAALLLARQGYDLTGVMLRLWTEPGKECENACCTPDSVTAARNVASIIGIPFYVIDVKEQFRKEVVEFFIDGYRKGQTPNPCLRCNQVIRWGFLLEEARNLGASYLATGHYAQIKRLDDGSIQLLRGIDPTKDQSYVLSGLSSNQLNSTILPLGQYKKSEIREIARDNNLPSAEKADSQDLCFLAGDDYRQFIRRYAPEISQNGPILTNKGHTLGEHSGLPDYTIGQRKGLGAFQEPYYVLGKDAINNSIIVGKKEELGADSCEIENINWILGRSEKKPEKVEIKIRYKSPAVPASLSFSENGLVCVKFDRKLRDITPGQQAAFYLDERCLGGGLISRVQKQ